MGEVYKARREAQTISSLNHPHIGALYDVGSREGVSYLVMEYLEGEPLSARLTRGPLAVEKILEYGMEITEALDQAHRRGVVHCDLKPGNLTVTKSGSKLLNFGLAKTVQSAKTSGQCEVPTRTMTLYGTCHYMAPELLEGKEADTRSDILAFGAVLYEMATGTGAFTGNTQAGIIAAFSSASRRPSPLCSSPCPKPSTIGSRPILPRIPKSAARARASLPGTAMDRPGRFSSGDIRPACRQPWQASARLGRGLRAFEPRPGGGLAASRPLTRSAAHAQDVRDALGKRDFRR